MARQCTAASSHYLSRADALSLSAYPVTIAGWFRSDTLPGGAQQMLVSALEDGETDEFLILATNNGDLVAGKTHGMASASASATASPSIDTWHHAAAVFGGDTSLSVSLDGGTAGTSSTSVTFPSAVNRFYLGSFNGAVQFHDGRLAEWAVWTAALSAEEIAALAKGITPSAIRPVSIVEHWNLFGNLSPEPGARQKLDVSITGATKGDHPRMFYR